MSCFEQLTCIGLCVSFLPSWINWRNKPSAPSQNKVYVLEWEWKIGSDSTVSTGWSISYHKSILQITQPSQYRYMQLRYRSAVISGNIKIKIQNKNNSNRQEILALTSKQQIRKNIKKKGKRRRIRKCYNILTKFKQKLCIKTLTTSKKFLDKRNIGKEKIPDLRSFDVLLSEERCAKTK